MRERRKYVNRAKFLSMMQSDLNTDGIGEKPYDERSYASADFAIFRHYWDPYDLSGLGRKDHYERVVNEAEFSRFFDYIKQEKKDVLNSLECVQTCIKAKHGLGRHIPIHFRMELD